MKIYVYAIAKNEEKFARRWLASMSEADGIFVLDTGSEDDTVRILRDGGAYVVTERIEPWRFDTARNHALSLVPEDADLCVSTDLDEVFRPGWRAALEKCLFPGVTRVRYRYTWNFTPDGREGYVFMRDNIHIRHGYAWKNPVHEVLVRTEGNEIFAKGDGMQLDHLSDPEKSRAQYLPLLELAVREDPLNDRNMHYLGREYMFRGMWDKSIETLLRHLALPTAVWKDERASSMRYIARCYARLGNEPECEKYHLLSIAEAPYLREVWYDYAMFLYRKKDWHGTLFAFERMMQITERPETYISETEPWGPLPFDVMSVAYYMTGDYRASAENAEKALSFSPDDERIRKNLEFARAKLGRE